MRVVQRPVGDGRAGDGGVEDVGPAQDGEGGQVAAERPAADGDLAEVEAVVGGGERLQGVDLVVEHRPGQVAVDRPLPRRPPPGRAPTVDDDDGEALVGQPLRREEGAPGPQHPLGVRPAVGVHQHREGLGRCRRPTGAAPPPAAAAPRRRRTRRAGARAGSRRGTRRRARVRRPDGFRPGRRRGPSTRTRRRRLPRRRPRPRGCRRRRSAARRCCRRRRGRRRRPSGRPRRR